MLATWYATVYVPVVKHCLRREGHPVTCLNGANILAPAHIADSFASYTKHVQITLGMEGYHRSWANTELVEEPRIPPEIRGLDAKGLRADDQAHSVQDHRPVLPARHWEVECPIYRCSTCTSELQLKAARTKNMVVMPQCMSLWLELSPPGRTSKCCY